jgi:hypothetical protein
LSVGVILALSMARDRRVARTSGRPHDDLFFVDRLAVPWAQLYTVFLWPLLCFTMPQDLARGASRAQRALLITGLWLSYFVGSLVSRYVAQLRFGMKSTDPVLDVITYTTGALVGVAVSVSYAIWTMRDPSLRNPATRVLRVLSPLMYLALLLIINEVVRPR